MKKILLTATVISFAFAGTFAQAPAAVGTAKEPVTPSQPAAKPATPQATPAPAGTHAPAGTPAQVGTAKDAVQPAQPSAKPAAPQATPARPAQVGTSKETGENKVNDPSIQPAPKPAAQPATPSPAARNQLPLLKKVNHRRRKARKRRRISQPSKVLPAIIKIDSLQPVPDENPGFFLFDI